MHLSAAQAAVLEVKGAGIISFEIAISRFELEGELEREITRDPMRSHEIR